MQSEYHQPVLLEEVLQGLALKPQGVYLDATFGRGGHSREILRHLAAGGRLLALDKDATAVNYAQQAIQDERFCIQQGSFTMLQQWLTTLQLNNRVDGILFDLGVSSPQLDNPQRGFSFLREGPLDMRMNQQAGWSAADWLQQAPYAEIKQVLKEYGEERFAARIAKAIVIQRETAPLTTTQQLAELIAAANPSREPGKHPATRSFQAIRIFINQELEEISTALLQSLEMLAIGGRLAVISFHSLEDRIVKRFMRKHARGDDFPLDLPVMEQQLQPRLKLIGKSIKPSAAEIKHNPRARSAVLRIAEKIA